MKRYNWQIILGLSLFILSAVVYSIHYLIFRDAHHIVIYLVGDIAFVFIEVLMVTLIIHRLLSEREKQIRLEKLNMVIGVFFSEIGTRLLAYFSDADPSLDTIRKELMVSNDWPEEEFSKVSKRLRNYDYNIGLENIDLEYLRTFLGGKTDLLLRLLENPTLLEHESFTELLRAVFHLTEELSAREDVESLPESDREHLAIDIKRAYVVLVHEWLDYMRFLMSSYPYLFSFAMRMNPFDQSASPIVT